MARESGQLESLLMLCYMLCPGYRFFGLDYTVHSPASRPMVDIQTAPILHQPNYQPVITHHH